jgi:hypothetical protein
MTKEDFRALGRFIMAIIAQSPHFVAGMAVGGALREGKGRPKRRGWGR